MSKILLISVVIGIASVGASAERVPLLVGGHAHGADNIQALSDLGIGNFVWIPKYGYSMGNTPWKDKNDILIDTEACVKNRMYFMISQRRGLGKSFKPGGGEYGGDTTPEIYSGSAIRRIQSMAGEYFVGLHAEELDIDLLQNSLRPGFRSRIPEIYNFTDRQGGRKAYEKELNRISKIYHGYGKGVRFMPDMCVTFQHSGFRCGGDIVMTEMLESLPNVELQLAYLRGGAQQFDKDWGIWVSPWYYGKVPSEDTELWPNTIAQPGEGHAPSSFRRCLYMSYVSGARVLTMQETEPIFSRKDGGGYKLAAWGAELKNFWDYAKNNTEQMKPIIELALMVDKNNGWAPGHLNGDWIDRESVWGKLPIEKSDNMLSRYLDVLLPNYGREKDWWKEKGRTYPGYFAQSPAGAFDIVASDISAKKLSKYPYVFMMADFDMNKDLLSVLREYVQNGGNLFVNANQMRHKESFVQDVEFLGAAIGEKYEFSNWSGNNLLMRRIYTSDKIAVKKTIAGMTPGEYPEPWYAAQDIQLKGAEVIADDGSGNPVLIRNKFGEGYVYLSTPEYMLHGFDEYKQTLSLYRNMILNTIKTSPINVTSVGKNTSENDISWTASYQGDSVIAAIANHGKSNRKVDVHWRKPCKVGTVEVGSKEIESKQVESGMVFTVNVLSEDIILLRIRL